MPASSNDHLYGQIPPLNLEGTNWAIFSMHFIEAMDATDCWGHFDGTDTHPVPADAAKPTSDEKEVMKSWDKEDKLMHQLLTQQLPDKVSMEVQDLKTVKVQWDAVKLEFSARSKHAKNNLKQEFLDMCCPRGGDVRAFLTSLQTKQNEIQAAGAKISNDEYEQMILQSIPGELAKFASNMQTATEISNTTLTMTCLIQSISKEADHMKLHRTHHQQGPGKGKNVDTTDEALAVTSLSSSHNG
jgi:gag-polypeptide of LTR copia-type